MGTKQRRGIQRRSAPNNTRLPASEDARDFLMTKAEFAKLKPALMRTLRRAGDPPPRTLEHGKAEVTSDRQFLQNLRELLARNADRGSVLVRGYKLLHIPLMTDRWGFWGGDSAWKASFHMVAAHPPAEAGSDKWIYEDASMPAAAEDAGLSYIFVPSSRAHPELTDEQALSNKWVLGYVIGGNAHFCELVIADQKLRGRRRSVLGLTPEEVVSKRAQKTYLMPAFESWHRLREIEEPIECVAEQLGFPVVDVDETLDLQNLKAIKFGMENNQEAAVDGYETLDLQVRTCAALRDGEMTHVQIRETLFKHYDAQYVLMEKRQSAAMDKVLAKMGCFAQGTAQSAC